MRIALLTYSTKPRGSVVHTWELAEALTELGHSVCVYALDKEGSGCDRHPSLSHSPDSGPACASGNRRPHSAADPGICRFPR